MSKKKEQKVKVYRTCSKCGNLIEVENMKLKPHVYLVRKLSIIDKKWCEGE